MNNDNEYKNYFMDMVSRKYIGWNIFKRIYSHFAFLHECNEISKSSPSLGVLWQFADFIRLSDRIFLLGSDTSNVLYSSDGYDTNNNGFVIRDDSSCTRIVYKLNHRASEVKIEVSKLTTNSKVSNVLCEFTFKNSKLDPSMEKYDDMLVKNIIDITNRNIINRMWMCRYKYGSYSETETYP